MSDIKDKKNDSIKDQENKLDIQKEFESEFDSEAGTSSSQTTKDTFKDEFEKEFQEETTEEVGYIKEEDFIDDKSYSATKGRLLFRILYLIFNLRVINIRIGKKQINIFYLFKRSILVFIFIICLIGIFYYLKFLYYVFDNSFLTNQVLTNELSTDIIDENYDVLESDNLDENVKKTLDLKKNYFLLPNVTINLKSSYSNDYTTFLVSIALEYDSRNVFKELKAKKSKLIDSIIDFFSNVSKDDFLNKISRFKIKKELKDSLNSILENKIKKIYFVEILYEE